MDPFSALGLASNICQLLDLGGKLVSGTVQLYRSVDGASSINSELQSITEDLTRLCSSLTQSESLIDGQHATQSELALIPLSISCKELGAQLLSVLDSLKVKARHQRFESFRQALKSEWKKKVIHSYEERLRSYRSEIAVHLMEILRLQQSGLFKGQAKVLERQSSAAVALDSLSASHRRLEITSVNEPARLRREIVNTLREAINDGGKKIEDALETMTGRLVALLSDVDVLTKELKIIESLRFPMISERQRRISEAHPHTYEWLFEETKIKKQGSPAVTMLEWLRTGNGTYWVSGKAGSGKSTLMKYLHNHKDTLTALRSWAGERKLVTAGHFFWYAGTDMQKSQQGLLQTLLYNVLRQDPTLVPSVCKSRWNDPVQFHDPKSSWTRQELLDAFSCLRKQSVKTFRFCFFVDGVDEYKGDHTEVIRILKQLASNLDIKVCFSSRPWNVFDKGYGENFGRKLEVEHLTQGDITKFVKEELFDDSTFQTLKTRDTRYDDLVKEIASKARGVFLWVFLVVRSLKRGLTNEDTILELQERLRILPEDLEEYFRRMLDSIEALYHRQAARLFLMRLDDPGTLSTMTVSYFDEDNPNFGLEAPMVPWSFQEIRERCIRTRVRVMARCTDLLELPPVSADGELADSRVDFLHRTVHDFLQTRNIHNLLTARAGINYDTNLFLCNSTLSQMKRLELRYKSHKKRFDFLMDSFMHHLSQMDIKSSHENTAIVNELDRVISVFRKTHPPEYINHNPVNVTARYPENWLITEIMKRRVYSYLSNSPDKLHNLIKRRCPDGLPPLNVALQCHDGEEADPRMIRLLLDHGASPNGHIGTVGQRTVWDSYLAGMEHDNLTGEQRQARVAILEELLLHGADPSVGDSENFFRSVVSQFATAEEVAHLEGIRLEKLSQSSPLRHIRKWLPWRSTYKSSGSRHISLLFSNEESSFVETQSKS